jgi:hypothetical protein
MWVRKTPEDKQSAERRFKYALIETSGITAIVLVLFAVGYRGGAMYGTPNFESPPPWNTYTAIKLVFVAVVVFIPCFLLRLRKKRPSSYIAGPTTMICTSCHTIEGERPNQQCACGASQEPLTDWKWVEG